MKTVIIAAAVSLSLTGAVVAQQEVATGSDAMMAGPGIAMGTAATMPLRYVEINDTDLVTSKLIGVDIYNKANEDVGEISDIVIGDGKSVIGIVASVGGFLGIGESYIVIDPASLALANDNGTWKAYVDTTKDDLSKAPKFDYSRLKK
ncbi:MAG: PRC-barrel domain-containing protein [Rhizobiaceae bacterium]|nr:PRC-barrel domain-containing protein [Rhizobiaceae bacterium]